jgi:hypothetical protein
MISAALASVSPLSEAQIAEKVNKAYELSQGKIDGAINGYISDQTNLGKVPTVKEVFDKGVEIISKNITEYLQDQVARELYNKHGWISMESAKKSANATVGRALGVLGGINTIAGFIVDVYRFGDQEQFKIKRRTDPYLDFKYLEPSYIDPNVTNFEVGDSMNFHFYVVIPDEYVQPYFNVYASVNYYAPSDTLDKDSLIESTYIPDANFNLTGGIHVNYENMTIPTNRVNGSDFHPLRDLDDEGRGGRIIVRVEDYPLTQSSTGYIYESTSNPYSMQITLYQGGVPGMGGLPYNIDTIFESQRIPFYLKDDTPPAPPP